MNSFLQKFLGSKTEKASQKLLSWMSDLADMDDIAALKLSTQHIALLVEDEELSIDQKLNFIIALEEINQQRLETLSHQFANLANLKSELEKNISETCYTYCRQSYIYHLKIIELVIDPTKFKLGEEKTLRIIARTINAAFNMLKWRLFVQQNPPTKMWLQTYFLYKIAHKQNLLNTPIELFPLSPATTLSAFIVQLCMFGQLHSANLEKQYIQIASKVIRIWLTHAHISQQHNPEQYLFYVDLEQDIAAKRMRKFEPNDHCRYWELDDLEKQITIAITVTDRGELPDSLIFSKTDDSKILNEALYILFSEWTKKEYVRQRRSEEREATSKSAKVKAGIFDICDQVLHANQINSGLTLSRQGDSLNDLILGHSTLSKSSDLAVNSSSLDTWIITDQSQHGLGARVNKYANTLARPKKLIGLVFDDDPTKVSIGIIKAAKATQGNQLRVGIEIISNLAIWTQLKPHVANDSFSNAVPVTNKDHISTQEFTNMSPGIYLPMEPELSKQATILMPKINFRPNTKYTIYISGKTKRVEFSEPIESNDDWVKLAIDF